MNPSDIYRRAPAPIQPHIRRMYDGYRRLISKYYVNRDFIPEFFDSSSEFNRYAQEFDATGALDTYEDALTGHLERVGSADFGSIRPAVGEQYYALVRALEPTVVVETGVCNGFSTLCVLHALSKNDHGHLHSIDYPYYADEDLSDFRAATFENYGGAAIPSDKQPGWIVPAELRSRWTLRTGKSQRELPHLVTNTDEIDLFIHDSEHSVPCMLYELELAWEWLAGDGVILVDDIGWNDAFDTFRRTRDADWGRLSVETGYLTG